jgi:predicted HicB family RNase H-like nuclease
MTETRNTHGGARIRPPGSKPAGRKPINPTGPQVKVTLRLDPDVHRQVETYATANKITFNQAINAMLSAI